MWGLIVPALLQIFGENGPLGQYFKTKQKLEEAKNEVALARINADKELAIAQASADTSQLQSRLSATSQSFKQGTFYPLWGLVIFSVLFPSKAEVMWHNFGLMPDWFQWLFLSVYSAIWGLPIVKGGYGAVTDLLQSRREYKIQKIEALNRKAVFDELKQQWFPKGMNQQQVDVVNKALDAGEQ